MREIKDEIHRSGDMRERLSDRRGGKWMGDKRDTGQVIREVAKGRER